MLLGRRLICYTFSPKRFRKPIVGSSMRVFQVSTKVIRLEELVGQVAFAKIVGACQVLSAHLSVKQDAEYRATIETLWEFTLEYQEGCFRVGKNGARPRMAAWMYIVLVTLRLIFMFEALWTVCTAVSLFRFV
jgi:hypothetical protein